MFPSLHATSEASHSVPVHSGDTARIRVQPVVEVKEAPDSRSGVGDGSGDPAIESAVHFAHTTTSSEDFIEDLEWMETTSKTDACENFTLLQNL